MALNRNTAELRTLHRTAVAWEATALPLSYTRAPVALSRRIFHEKRPLTER
jgi:hypothetical protein